MLTRSMSISCSKGLKPRQFMEAKVKIVEEHKYAWVLLAMPFLCLYQIMSCFSRSRGTNKSRARVQGWKKGRTSGHGRRLERIGFR